MFKKQEKQIQISVAKQMLVVKEQGSTVAEYSISTALNGVGQQEGSEQTPLGRHQIRAKIGGGCEIYTVFIGRRPTGERYTPALGEANPGRDWILSRILWLSGLEPGKNRLGSVDSMRRYIYIHGTPDTEPMGTPKSHGCIRMRNEDVITLFNWAPVGCVVDIQS